MSDARRREVDPTELRLPPSRASGADPWKLHREIRQHGSSKQGMPPVLVYEDPDGLLEIFDGVTRATRIAKLAPGTTVPVVVIGAFRHSRKKSIRLETISKAQAAWSTGCFCRRRLRRYQYKAQANWISPR